MGGQHYATWRGWMRHTLARLDEYDTMLTESVAAARASGATWEQIGEVLGVTAQAAHSRFNERIKTVASPRTFTR